MDLEEMRIAIIGSIEKYILEVGEAGYAGLRSLRQGRAEGAISLAYRLFLISTDEYNSYWNRLNDIIGAVYR